MTRRKKPSLSETLAKQERERRQDFAAVNLPDDAATNPNHADIEVARAGAVRDGRKVEANSARRLDAFAALRDGMAKITGAYDAARRLERDVLTRYGETDRGPSLERVDGKPPKGDFMDARIAAGERVDQVLERLSEREAWLLVELIRNTLNHATWRAIVHHITGETHEHAQGAAVRSACANLAEAYRRIDGGRRAA